LIEVVFFGEGVFDHLPDIFELFLIFILQFLL